VSMRMRALPDRIPDPVRRWALRALFQATADAFGAPMPDLRGRSADAILTTYSAYTDEHARGVFHDPARRALVERRLCENTERIGHHLRLGLGIRTTTDALEIAHRLYRLIGIELTGNERGRVVVTRCVFAASYSPDVCRVMSASDAGLMAGLTGGARLRFTERITSGSPACRATLTVDGSERR